MAPLFLFLASAFNTELVYVILKGITKFSDLVATKLDEKAKRKLKDVQFVMDDGNMTVTLNHIKIKDIDKWEAIKTDQDLTNNAKDDQLDAFRSTSNLESAVRLSLLHRYEKTKQEMNVVKINSTVTVTYHKMDMFMTMFPKYFNDNLHHFRESLSPKFNRDSVFKAGEGAGRSGSFFFFSHDRKFIIKTMS
jgi:hypothetical protein